MSKHSTKYSQISTIAELRAERKKIARKIDKAQNELSESYNEFREMFSVGYLTNLITEQLQLVYGWAEWAYKGYQFVTSLFRKKESNLQETDTASEGTNTGAEYNNVSTNPIVDSED